MAPDPALRAAPTPGLDGGPDRVSAGPAAAVARRPRPGDVLEVAVERLEPRGGALGTSPGASAPERVRLQRARPGSRVRARVLRRRGRSSEAVVLAELDPGPWAVEPRCAHAALCGGCSFQGVAYGRQLEELRAFALQAFAPLTALGVDPGALIGPVLPAPEAYGYRNKMEFTFSNRRWIEEHEPRGVAADFALGLHLPGRHDKVLDIARCEIQFEQGNAILASARSIARELGLTAWDLRLHSGLLRHLVLRRAAATGEILVELVTSDEAPKRVEAWAAELLRRHPEITTLVHTTSTRAASVATGGERRVLHGPGAIREVVAGLSFSISAQAFFQVNSAQAERLVAIVREEARLTGDEVVWDLFSGAGLFSLALAGRAREVWGFELSAEAVRDARANADANGIRNAHFVQADLAELRPGAGPAPDAPPPQVCVVDPPRAGLHPKAIPALVALAPARIAMVSCNPVSAARDAAPLIEAGWRLERVRPVDLVPHTPHLECVLSLAREPASP